MMDHKLSLGYGRISPQLPPPPPHVDQSPRIFSDGYRLPIHGPSITQVQFWIWTMISCENCRSKHLKCDDKPQCTRCERADQECIRGTKRTFQPVVKNSFGRSQTWLPVPPRVDFVIENPDYEDDIEDSSQSRKSVDAGDTDIAQQESVWNVSSNRPFTGVDNSNGQPTTYHETTSSVAPSYNLLPAEIQNTQIRLPGRHGFMFTEQSSTFLHNEQDVRLFRHFIDHVSHFFDFVDGDRHFAREVPQRARHNKPLALAILALAARHLNRTSTFDSYVADQYLQDCVEIMIPYLGDANAVADDSLFAAVVILRFLEEVNVPIAGADSQNHLVGTQALIAASQRSSPRAASGFRRACYACAFRQELYMSMMQQRSPQWRVPPYILATEPSDDWAWARRAVEYVADVLEFAFGNSGKHNHASLLEQIEKWQNDSPPGFQPLLSSTHNTSVTSMFPPIYLQLDCHALGWVYNLVAHALLTAYGPRPKIGPSRKQAMQEIDNTIRDDLRLICGVALGNPQAPGASLVASMAIALLGDRFENRHEQEALHNMLVDTETVHGWPTGVPQKELELAWNWSS